MLHTVLKYTLIVVVAAGLGLAKTGSAQAQGLVDLLVSQLGVTSEQASGGAGAMFDLAKQRLAPDEFSQIAGAVPGMDSMLSAAPATTVSAAPAAEDTSGATGQAASPAGDLDKMTTGAGAASDKTGSLGSMADMASKATGGAKGLPAGAGGAMGTFGALGGSFEQLGMSPDMVQKFMPVVLDYVNSQGGTSAMKLLQGALL